jgi:hypothetical protein
MSIYDIGAALAEFRARARRQFAHWQEPIADDDAPTPLVRTLDRTICGSGVAVAAA